MGYFCALVIGLWIPVISCISSSSAGSNTFSNSSGMNVLFLIADDMRPQLGCYDGQDAPSPIHPKMHTPNLDILASKSLLLKRAYIQQALCSPSRTSFLTGRRPDTTHIYNMGPYFRQWGGDFTTLPQYFKQQGYITAGLGKVFHPGSSSHGDDPPSWSESYYHAPNYDLWQYQDRRKASASWMSVPYTLHQAKPLPDQQIANTAAQRLEKYAKQDKPFFLAVGFHKPHLPFVFPAEFIKYYPIESVQLPPNSYAPEGMPPIAWFNYMTSMLRGYSDIKYSNYTGKYNTSIANTTVMELRRAYYSAVSYTDSLVGQVLDKLDQLGLAKNTIVSFLGDHGWQLGEHGEWCKQTNFELATRIPMMVHVPGKTDHGIVTHRLVEAVDLYPTIVEAAGLPTIPICPEGKSTKTKLCREGTSLMPLIANQTGPWKTAVFSQYPRRPGVSEEIAFVQEMVEEDYVNYPIMGYSVRTDQLRYTEWVKFHGTPKYQPDWSKSYGVELYDHGKDPEENKNQANNPEYKDTVEELSKLLHSGWRNVPLQGQ